MIFLYTIFLFWFLFPSFVYSQYSSDHKVSLDKGDVKTFIGSLDNKGNRKFYKGDELKTIGMPIGGICAGQLYVRGDGSLANWWVANNAYNTGWGKSWYMDFDTNQGPWKVCYQTFEPFSYIDQGVSIIIENKSNIIRKELSKKDFDNISFVGEYPIAFVDYKLKNKVLPVDVSAEFFSPFIPLDARNSANPATVMKYLVKNTSSETLKVSLESRLQNLVCIDLNDKTEGLLRNKAIKNENYTSLYMDFKPSDAINSLSEKDRYVKVFDDFESGTYSNWKIMGKAFGNNPVSTKEVFTNQTDRLNSFFVHSNLLSEKTGKLISRSFKITKEFICFDICGGSYIGKTCFNLVVDGKIAFSATGKNRNVLLPHLWNVKDYIGKTAHFELIDESLENDSNLTGRVLEGNWGYIAVDNIKFANYPCSQEKYTIDSNHPFYGNVSLSVLDKNAKVCTDISKDNSQYAETELGNKLVGKVTSSIELKPGESKEVVFILSWYFPNRPMNYDGTDWNWQIIPHQPAIGNMYANWYDSSKEVADYIVKHYNYLSDNTHLFHDTYYDESTLPYWLNQRLMIPISVLATETCQWWATDKFWAWEGVGSCPGTCTHVWGYAQAMAALFPELERNLREKTDYSVSLQDDGGILSRNGDHGVLIDGHATVILRTYREHLMSKDNLFLSRNWDKVKRALKYLIHEDGNKDGLIVKTQPNTYDISFNGANTYVGGLYLSALRAGEKMAIIMKDTLAADYYRNIYTAGSVNSMDRLWNGHYFIQDVDEKEYPKYQYGKGCLSDQLFGQTWASLYRLGDIYPKQAIETTLRSIWNYNWTNNVAEQTKLHIPERYFAHDGEPGLFICTWPFDTHPGENGVRYRDEVWTGIEYQVATEMINRNMLDEGLAIVKGIHSRYDAKKHNPWNEVECGDHYARSMASYGVLQAIEGLWYDGPRGILCFGPKIQKNNFKGFFSSAQGWGNIVQKIENQRQVNTIELKYGRLQLTSIEINLVNNSRIKKDKKCTVILNNNPIKAKVFYNGNVAKISFEKILLDKGDILSLFFD